MLIIRNIIKYTVGLIFLIPATIMMLFIALFIALGEFIVNGNGFIKEISDAMDSILPEWKPIRR